MIFLRKKFNLHGDGIAIVAVRGNGGELVQISANRVLRNRVFGRIKTIRIQKSHTKKQPAL